MYLCCHQSLQVMAHSSTLVSVGGVVLSSVMVESETGVFRQASSTVD
jgi:hypothetical protein